MKVNYEAVKSSRQCSFCILHIEVPVNELCWEYHYHPEIEIVFVVSGSGTRHVGYHKSTYNNGDLVLIGSNVPHSGFGFNAIDPHEEIVLQFKEEIISFSKEVEDTTNISKLISLSKLGLLFGTETKKKIAPKLFALLEAENAKKYILLLGILFELADTDDFVVLNKEVMPYTILSKNKKRLQVIFTFVERNYDREIAIHEIASLANLTLPAFCSFFKKTTKMTFTDFLNQFRIDKACTMILQGKSVSDSCYQSGYNNLSYFSRTFKKYTGKTPTQFNNGLLK